MELFSKQSSFYNNEELEESNPLVLMTYGYDKEKLNGRKIINGNFEILEKIGEGSFWTVYKVERSVSNDSIEIKRLHVFKEGKLSLLSQEDDIIEENETPERVYDNIDIERNMNNLKSLHNESLSDLNNIYSQDINDLDTIYSDNNIKDDQRLALKELFLLRKINHKNVTRLYECIIDESIDKIVFVMEYCDLGQLMKYNSDETGYEYNKKLILFLFKKLFIENRYNQKNIIFELIKFKENKRSILTEEILMEKFNSLGEEITEDNENENEKFIFDIFEQNFKLKIYFCKIFLKQIIEAVRYLHSKNICNRDIKPENIVFKNTFDFENIDENATSLKVNEMKDEFLKITDFSISKIYKTKNVKIISFAGSDLFKAPEMLNYEYFNPFKAEIYSIGVTLIYFLFKKFYKCKLIKNWSDEERNKIFENFITKEENKNEFDRKNSKLIMMNSNSFLNRPRKSSFIYNNFEKLDSKEYISNFEETKHLFEYYEETEFYEILKSLIHENPDQRMDIENCLLDF